MDVNEVQEAQQDLSQESVMDLITSTSKNTMLDETQIQNIGKGLYADSPFSSINGGTNINIGFDRINQSFKIILSTILEEVPMLPILGSRVPYILFEQADEVLQDTLELYITQALRDLEPRAEILTTSIILDQADQNKVPVEIEYRLTNTNIVKVFRDTIVTSNGGDVIL